MNTLARLTGLCRHAIVYCAVALVVSSTVAGPVLIPSGSMEPTTRAGDYLLVNRVAYGLHTPFTLHDEVFRWSNPARGDIVIFNAPVSASAEEVLFIKRTVAVAGDVVTVRNHRLVVNGQSATYTTRSSGALTETLDGTSHGISVGKSSLSEFGPFTVPAGHIFVMGDHRNSSADSRVWGALPLDRVRGKAVARIVHVGERNQGPAWLD